MICILNGKPGPSRRRTHVSSTCIEANQELAGLKKQCAVDDEAQDLLGETLHPKLTETALILIKPLEPIRA
jgi:hypothetical protein